MSRDNAYLRDVLDAARAIRRYLAGERLLNVVRPELGY